MAIHVPTIFKIQAECLANAIADTGGSGLTYGLTYLHWYLCVAILHAYITRISRPLTFYRVVEGAHLQLHNQYRLR
jgi:hypothetical protein